MLCTSYGKNDLPKYLCYHYSLTQITAPHAQSQLEYEGTYTYSGGRRRKVARK